jgi:hypothetical protein
MENPLNNIYRVFSTYLYCKVHLSKKLGLGLVVQLRKSGEYEFNDSYERMVL